MSIPGVEVDTAMKEHELAVHRMEVALERVLRKWGLIDGEAQTLDERRKLAMLTLLQVARRAEANLLSVACMARALNSTEREAVTKVANTLHEVAEGFEKEFKL